MERFVPILAEQCHCVGWKRSDHNFHGEFSAQLEYQRLDRYKRFRQQTNHHSQCQFVCPIRRVEPRSMTKLLANLFRLHNERLRKRFLLGKYRYVKVKVNVN